MKTNCIQRNIPDSGALSHRRGIFSVDCVCSGNESLTALELILADGLDISEVYKTRRQHLPAILSTTSSFIRLDVQHILEFTRNALLKTDMIGGFSDAGKHLRDLCCTLEAGPPHASVSAPGAPPHLNTLQLGDTHCTRMVQKLEIAITKAALAY
jgi:hypothetical protein